MTAEVMHSPAAECSTSWPRAFTSARQGTMIAPPHVQRMIDVAAETGRSMKPGTRTYEKTA